MESLETTAAAEGKSTKEGLEQNVAQRKWASEPTTVHTNNRSPLADSEGEGWHLPPQENQSRNTCGSTEMSDSGKLRQLEDQHSQQPHVTPSHQHHVLSPYAPQQESGQSFSFARQKTLGHLVSVPPPHGSGSCGPTRKSPSLPAAALKHCSSSQLGLDQLPEDVCKMEQKPQKPGKYVCDYCGRACAKPSVLKKHIRSHTGERPYPCVPCGFSFKTKSNLYKHRKSHAHSVKAGTVPFSELGSYNANMDQGSFEGEGELYSDAEQSTDTDEDALNDSLLLDCSAVDESDSSAVQVLHLITQKQGVTQSMSAEDGSSSSTQQLREINASPVAIAQVSRAIQSCTIKQRLALRLSEKRSSSDTDQSLSLPSQSSKGSTDSGYFSRSESAEQQSGPPNTNAKSYQEIMFGKCYRPSPKQSTTTVVTCGGGGKTDLTDYVSHTGKTTTQERGVSRVFTQEKELVESIKINTHSFTREEIIKESQLDVTSSDAGPLIRSNSMPTSSGACLNMPQGLRGSHSFDERTSPGGMRRLRRQAAFELSPHDLHTEPDSYGNISESISLPLSGVESVESFSEMAPNTNAHQKQAMEFATRKRRKEKCVGEEDDFPAQYDIIDNDHSEEMFDSTRDYDSKQSSQHAVNNTTLSGREHSQSVHTQLDRYNMDISVSTEATGRKPLGNVISVIQHTNSLCRSQSEKSEPYNCHSQRQGAKLCSSQTVELTETLEMDRKRTEIIGHQLSDSRLDQSYQMAHKLVRQSNIQVPEIRVTVEPDSPEKAPEVKVKVKEPERPVEEFQWPQRSETLSQFPPEKLPPKKKRLRLADIEHSSGESSFESACTSLSRSPSQDSNLSYSSSISFDREESFKSASSPARQDEFGKPLELLAVPGSGHSLSVLNQRQQHEMRRSSSEQAPCNLRREFPELRSISFDYGSLSPTSKVRHGELTGHSAMKEPRRGNLVRQESLNMDPEFTQVLPQMFPQYLSNALSFSTTAVFSQALPIFATGYTCPQQPHSGLLVPVRIQTHVPSYGSITYTTVSQILDNQYDNISSITATSQNLHAKHSSANLDTSNMLRHTQALSTDQLQVQVLDLSTTKLKTGIPLSLTSRTISTTNAFSGGSNKRMLSPASSLDLFMEVKQQKRVKEEKMFGQIVEEMSAVEIGNCYLTEEKLKSEIQSTSTLYSQDDPLCSGFISLNQKVTGTTGCAESAMDNTAPEPTSHPYSMLSLTDIKEEIGMDTKVQMDISALLGSSKGALITDVENSRLLSQFPSLRTTTGVSWCYLNYTKPNSTHSSTLSSVYATWCVSSHNPNPPNMSTSATLALFRSKQRKDSGMYTMAAMYQPGTGKLVSATLLWRQRLEQRKPELKEVDIPYGRKVKDLRVKGKAVKEDWKEREISSKQATPTRIKIFEGGFKSNEEYVYVRGRGRGKYICEECGIRCKKPSMLKKHIRTHTDVRPYVCRVCNFAFKTKGNLTKHMKSKAHMKKCFELGLSVTLDDAEAQEFDDIQQESKLSVATKHQFSDADDSDGMDEEIDENDEDDDEDDEYEGDSTLKISSRSTSPQPCAIASLSVTATAVIHGVSPDIHGCSLRPFSSCLTTTTTLPGTELQQHLPQSRKLGPDRRTVLASVDAKQRERPVEEDSLAILSPEQGCLFFDPYPSCLLSPGWESPLREPSPSRLRYPSPRRELSPRGRSSPRWDTSPLRPSSPNLSPIQHLSPGSIERPLSPGAAADLAGRRDPAARGRQRVVLRAVSPRRGYHQHQRTSGDRTREQAKAQLVPLGGAIEMYMDQRKNLPPTNPPGPSASPHHSLFSHLPLHSQQLAHTLLPMVPIGGIHMLQSPPSSSSTDVIHSAKLSPQKSQQQPSSRKEGSVRVQGVEDSPGQGQGQQQQQDMVSSYQTTQDSQEKTLHLTGRDSKQEESVQTCMKAIESLRITSEDPL